MGYLAKATIAPGRIITPRAVAMPPAVKRGQGAKIVYRNGGVSITAGRRLPPGRNARPDHHRQEPGQPAPGAGARDRRRMAGAGSRRIRSASADRESASAEDRRPNAISGLRQALRPSAAAPCCGSPGHAPQFFPVHGQEGQAGRRRHHRAHHGKRQGQQRHQERHGQVPGRRSGHQSPRRDLGGRGRLRVHPQGRLRRMP